MKAISNLLTTAVIVSLLVLPTNGIAETKPMMNEKTSDLWLEAKLGTTYALNQHLSLFDIGLDVKNQVAYLSGTVGSDIEKDLAENVAKSIEGIRSVENKIIVDEDKATATRTANSKSNTRSFGQVVSDLTTTASVKTQLLTNKNVDGLDVNVDTERDRVTLQGTVKTDIEKALAGQIAANTSGVKGVTNNLRVE